jgi:PAS domain S-box-containing protein
MKQSAGWTKSIETSFPILRSAILTLVTLAILAAFAAPARGANTEQTRHRVLILHSYHVGFTWSDNITRGIRAAFAATAEDVELCFEFMDTRRLFTEDYFEELARLYSVKYAARPVDVIICSDDHALNFTLSRGQDVFPDTPVVFCSVSGFDSSMREGRELTGLRESIDIEATLDVALSLHPTTRSVVVITDMTRTGRALKDKALEVFSQYEPALGFRYLENLTVEELEQAVSQLGEDEIVFLFIFSRDRDGRVFSHEQNLRRLAPHCSVPIYAVWEFYLGHGIMGGKLTNGEEEGRLAGELALRVLRGEEASEIPIGTSPTKYMFDFRQLDRFGIDLSALPRGSEVINRPFSFYQTYKRVIFGVVAVIVVLLGLILFLIVNIRRRRRGEVALRKGEERLQLALQGGDLGTWDWNVVTGAVTFNERSEAMLGYGFGDTESKLDSWDNRIHPDDVTRFREALDDHFAGRTDFYEAEYRAQTVNGNWIWVHDKGTVVERNINNEPVRVTGILRDVTDRRKAEEERHTLEAQVQHTQKLESLGVLAGGIAHDFNNLLTGIMGNANLALTDLHDGSSARENVAEIEKASIRAAELCKQMLAYSGRGSFIIEKIDVSEMLREMAHLLEVSTSKKAVIKYHFAEKLPLIEADVTQLRQIAMNLITNASEAIGAANGIITVRTGATQCDRAYLHSSYFDEDLPEGKYVFLEVADTGCGMDDDTKKRIFDPFFTSKFTGRGLGLSAVLGIVRGHNGAVRIDTAPGEGTTFRVLFPTCDEASTAEAESLSKTGDSGESWSGAGSVLVVDDDETVRDVATRMLKRMGFDVLTAPDGGAALRLFEERGDEIVCVLLDLTMPQMDGVECFRELRRLKPDVRVILSSGYNEQEATQRFTGEGLAGFVQKPYVKDILSDRIRKILES